MADHQFEHDLGQLSAYHSEDARPLVIRQVLGESPLDGSGPLSHVIPIRQRAFLPLAAQLMSIFFVFAGSDIDRFIKRYPLPRLTKMGRGAEQVLRPHASGAQQVRE